jgi:hypothetical protein
MEDALSGNIAEFGSLDFVEGFFARTKARERVVAGRIARMDDSTLVPVPAIDFKRIVHIDLESTRVLLSQKSRGTGAAGRVCWALLVAAYVTTV